MSLRPCSGALRLGVAHGVAVVPHALEVRDVAAEALDLLVQRAVGVVVRAHQQVLGRLAELRPASARRTMSRLPPTPPDATTTVSARSSSSPSRTPVTRPPVLLERGDERAEAHVELRPARVRLDRLPHLLDERAARPPRQVEARDRVAVAVDAALGPVDDREELDADAAQPAADVVARAPHVRLGPRARQLVLGVELGDAQPVGERELRGVLDARAPLLGRVDHEHAAERLAGQAAELVRLAAVEQHDAAAVLEQLQGGDEPGDAGADDHHVGRGVHGPRACRIRRAGAARGATIRRCVASRHRPAPRCLRARPRAARARGRAGAARRRRPRGHHAADRLRARRLHARSTAPARASTRG